MRRPCRCTDTESAMEALRQSEATGMRTRYRWTSSQLMGNRAGVLESASQIMAKPSHGEKASSGHTAEMPSAVHVSALRTKRNTRESPSQGPKPPWRRQAQGFAFCPRAPSSKILELTSSNRRLGSGFWQFSPRHGHDGLAAKAAFRERPKPLDLLPRRLRTS